MAYLQRRTVLAFQATYKAPNRSLGKSAGRLQHCYGKLLSVIVHGRQGLRNQGRWGCCTFKVREGAVCYCAPAPPSNHAIAAHVVDSAAQDLIIAARPFGNLHNTADTHAAPPVRPLLKEYLRAKTMQTLHDSREDFAAFC